MSGNPAARILILCPYLPYPADEGGKIRIHALLRELAPHNEITLLCLTPATPAARDVAALEALGITVECVVRDAAPRRSPARKAGRRLALYARGRSNTVAINRSRHFAAALARLLRERPFDIVQAEYAAMAQYLPLVPDGVKTVLIEHDVTWELAAREQQLQRSPLARGLLELELRALRRYEREVAARADVCVTVSEIDRTKLARYTNGRGHFVVVPNGVDLERNRFTPYADRQPYLVFSGAMGYPANVDAAIYCVREIMPLIWARRPDVTLQIAGKEPAAAVTRLAAEDPRVIVTGTVPDIRPHVQQAAVALLPLRVGSGTRLRALETMALGTPLVTTSVGIEGLDARHGEHAAFADTPEAFADAVLTLLEEPEKGRALATQARELVEQHYGWTAIAGKLNALYQRLAAQARAEAPSVCLVTRRLPPEMCGVGDYTLRLGRALVDRGITAAILTSTARERQPDGKVTIIPAVSHWNLRGLCGILRALRRQPCAVVNLQYVPHLYGRGGVTSLWLLPALVRVFLRRRVVVTFHELYLPWSRRPRYALIGALQRAQALAMVAVSHQVTVTTDERARTLRRLLPWKRDAIQCIPVGTNVAPPHDLKQSRREVRRQLGIRAETTVLGMFGALHPERDFELAYRAVAALRDRQVDAHLLCVGKVAEDHPRFQQLRRLADALDIADQITWAIGPPEEAVADHLAAMDLFLALQHGGAAARHTTLIAALAHQLPVIATNGPATDAALAGSAAVTLVAADPQALATVIASLVPNADERQRRGAAARCLFDQRFAWPVLADRFARLYGQALTMNAKG